MTQGWRVVEDVERDKERVAEYERLYGGVSIQGPLTVELRTGIIIAARFADKLRRAAFAAFRKTVPEDVILRDVAELNRHIYNELIRRGIDKLSLIRISVLARYNEKENRIEFSDIKIERLYTEEEVQRLIEDKEARVKELESRIEELEKRVRELEGEIIRCKELEEKFEKLKSVLGLEG